MEKHVEHEGTVVSVCGDTMIVRIIASPACAGCAAGNRCAPSGNKGRDIRVDGFSGDFVPGERVRVIMRQSMGIRALCIGYMIPFVVVLITLAAAYRITGDELAAGFCAILILVPYYGILRLLNRKITKTFGFTVQKINVA